MFKVKGQKSLLEPNPLSVRFGIAKLSVYDALTRFTKIMDKEWNVINGNT